MLSSFLLVLRRRRRHLHQLRPRLRVGGPHQLREEPARVPQQLPRRPELGRLPRAHHQDAIRVHDGVEAVSDGQHRAGGELAADGGLDQGVSPERGGKYRGKIY